MPRPETLLQRALRAIYRAPDGRIIEKFNGSLFEPSSEFATKKVEDIDTSGGKRPATPTEIQAAINRTHIE